VADHLFTTRQLQLRDDSVDADYVRIGAAFSIAGPDVVRVRQVHGRTVLSVRAREPVPGVPDADAIVSMDATRAVSVRVADCVPILLADRAGRAVAAIHAGWRGVAAGIVSATVSALRRWEVPAIDLLAGVGPAIGPCCYQVDEPVREAFETVPGSETWFAQDGRRWRLDLWEAVRDQLISAGVPRAAIYLSRRCTAHQPGDWFSHRRDGPGTGRMVAAIRLRPPGTIRRRPDSTEPGR
jgi:YfiH family protein